MNNFEESLNNKLKMIDDYILATIDINCPAEIKNVLKYALFPSGKRIRPLLALSVCEMLEGNLEEALPYAVAIELIHPYSLIHDDLPSMDNADYRRGKPSVHKAFGEALAILAGDALLNLAYEIMLKDGNSKYAHVIPKIAEAAGLMGMISGQVLDISKNKPSNKEEILHLYSLKTGKLFEVAFNPGYNRRRPIIEEELLELGQKIGLAFQIKDDLLDIYGSEELGKPLGQDLANEKNTIISFIGVEETELIYKNLISDILKVLDTYNHSEFLTQIIVSLTNRQR